MEPSPASLADLVGSLAPYRGGILYGLVAFPVLGPALGQLGLLATPRLGDWLLSMVVHLAVFMVVPSVLVIAYLGLATSTNLVTQVDAVLTFGPLVSGIATLFVVPRIRSFDDIPGFDRLQGLMLLVGMSSVLAFLIMKTRIFVSFFVVSNISQLLFLAFVVYLAMKAAFGMAFRGEG